MANNYRIEIKVEIVKCADEKRTNPTRQEAEGRHLHPARVPLPAEPVTAVLQECAPNRSESRRRNATRSPMKTPRG